MLSLDDMLGVKKEPKPVANAKVFHVTPIPKDPEEDTQEEIADPVPEVSPQPILSTPVTPTSLLDLSQMSKEEILIVLAYDRNFASRQVASQREIPKQYILNVPEHKEEVASKPVKMPGVKQVIKWREYGGWWLSIILAVVLFGLIIVSVGR